MQFFMLIRRVALGDGSPGAILPGKQYILIFEIGVFQGPGKKINTQLRKYLRKLEGKDSQPSAAAMDSQTVKTTSVGGIRGYDGGKKVNGRKRHILVDTLGLLLTVVVHAANIQDREGGILVLQRIMGKFSKLKVIWVDGGYRGLFIDYAKIFFQRTMEILLRSDQQKGFKVVRKRWVIERTFSWISNYRRHSKDYEKLPESSEAMVYISMIHLMINRI